MSRQPVRFSSPGLAWFLMPLSLLATDDRNPQDPDKVRFFENRIRPVLIQECYSCHSADAAQKGNLKAGLLVDSKSGLLKGGESGPALVPGNPKTSLLIDALRHGKLEMPPGKKLDERTIRDFENWIRLGAVDPRKASDANGKKWMRKQGRQHWSYRRLKPVSPPSLDSDWIRNTIDQFVLKRMLEQKITPARRATPETLVRRVHFDLLGLPPAPEQNDRLPGAPSATAFSALIDRLLESPHFGERWGRHWLDVARFGESEGSNPEEDKPRHDAYRYRDAVIRAFNQDMPFDEFVARQLSGSGLQPSDLPSPLAADLNLFVRLGTKLQRNSHPNDKKFHMLDDMISATGSAFLGMTIECARCHDHKVDPVSSEEYYQLSALFFDLARVTNQVGSNKLPVIEHPHLLGGGKWQRPIRKVTPGFVTVLTRDHPDFRKWLNHAEPRQALSRWMTDVEDGAGGMLARVIVNRLWQHHFGRGLVDTPNDFGRLGSPPTHPQLLDWLALELIKEDWKLKPLHRLILNSATWQQASSDQWMAKDSENQWLWHYRPRRLSAEAIRDNLLAVSGSLDTKMYGPSIPVGTNRTKYVEKSKDWRRSIYLMNSRFQLHPILKTFDGASNFRSQGKRGTSTTPTSALYGLNSKFVWDQARLLAKRVESSSDPAERIESLYQLAFARRPSDEETLAGLKFIESTPGQGGISGWVLYCHALLNVNEFIYVR
ncbi:MAG: PSD1 and planctomycete cytochrome C domain-containing protein [Planctomycetota bacterium]|nr:PSD1 and planctomycete cytochrome C domain-containing protein [Planctomycetota bacterium]